MATYLSPNHGIGAPRRLAPSAATLRRDGQLPPALRPAWAPLWLIVGLMLAFTATACDENMDSPSTLESPQILAVQFTPRTLVLGETHTAEVLGHNMGTAPLSFEACLLPWIGDADGVQCSATDFEELPEFLRAPIPLGSADEATPNTVEFAIPAFPQPSCEVDADCYGLGTCVDGTCPVRLWIRVIDPNDEAALTTVAQITTGDETLVNPEVSALSATEEGTAMPETVTVGSETVVIPTMTDPYGEGGRVTSYFTTAGRFDPWRTNEGTPSTFTAPTEPGEVTLTVLVRDPGGGVGWTEHTLNVTEAETP